MRSRSRGLEFDSLERLMLLSSAHPAIAHGSHAVHSAIVKFPPYVQSVKQLAKSHGSHVSVETLVTPGYGTDYVITFQARNNTYTTTIFIPVRTPPGPTPG